MPTDPASWHDVGEVLVRCLPGGPASRGWEREQIEGMVTEFQEIGMQPAWVIVGIRAAKTGFEMSSVPDIRRLYRESLPPMTAVQIEEAAERQAERRRLEAADDEPRGLPEAPS